MEQERYRVGQGSNEFLKAIVRNVNRHSGPMWSSAPTRESERYQIMCHSEELKATKNPHRTRGILRLALLAQDDRKDEGDPSAPLTLREDMTEFFRKCGAGGGSKPPPYGV